MKPNNKRILFAMLVTMLIASMSVAMLTVSAATKETQLTSGVLTARGAFNIVEWEKVGDNTDTVYSVDNRGSFLRYQTPYAWNAWMLLGDAVSRTKDVTVEWDVTNITYDTYFLPTYWSQSYAGALQNTDFFYSEYALGSFPKLSANNRYRLVYGTDGSLEISTAPIAEDGAYGDFTVFAKKENFVTIPDSATDAYYFGFLGHTANGGAAGGMLDIDNVKFMSGTDVLINQNFEKEVKIESNGIPTAGTITVLNGAVYQICEIEVDSPAANNKLLCTEQIKLDPYTVKCADIVGSIRMDQVADNDKVGIALGLNDGTETIGSENVSFIYFENEAGVTYVNVMNGATAGEKKSLEADFTGKFIDFTVSISKDKKAVVSVGEKSFTFDVANVQGKVAITHSLAGTAKYAVGKNFSIKNYSYLEGDGKTLGQNFNTGYIDSKNYIYEGFPATQFEDSAKAEGIKIEDGKLFFKGTSDGSYFGFTGTYADFILEFDYTTLAIEDRPAISENYPYGYSAIGIYFGANQYAWSGDSNHGKAVYLIDNYNDTSIMQFAYWNEGGSTYNTLLESYTPQGGTNVEDGKVSIYKKTNKIKIVAANNTVSIYAVTLEEGKALSEYTSADYKLLGSYECKSTYGLVNITSSEAGYFRVDNLKITNIDAKTEQEVADKVAAYVDFQEIADDVAPEKLGKPVLKLNGNVVTWDAVAHATGYEIKIGDEVTAVSADTLSYTFTQTEQGEYTLYVKAIYSGEEKFTDGDAESIVYKVEKPDTSSSETSDSTASGCGCPSDIGVVPVFVMAAAVIAVTLLMKKKEN